MGRGWVLMSGKKKLLIVNNNLDMGGIQRALINLLLELDRRNLYEVDLFLFSRSGQYADFIPDSIRTMEGNKRVKILGVSQEDSRRIGWWAYWIRGMAAVYSKIFDRSIPTQRILSSQTMLKGYDVAISYMHDPDDHTLYGGCNWFVLNRVEADRKITFVHCDFKNFEGNTPLNRKLYKEFDSIAVVSNGCMDSFVEVNPDLADRVAVVYNCQEYQAIREMAQKNPIIYEGEYIHVVTVCRISHEKGIIRMIPVMEKLAAEGEKIKWHIIGTGPLELELTKRIRERRLENTILIHGYQPNPYRFIKNADLLLVPSCHEAAPMVFGEGKGLGIPVLTTDTTSAKELVWNEKAGWVCENSEEGLYRGLKHILEHRSEIEAVKKFLGSQKLDNERPMEQFQRIIQRS